MFGSRRVNCCVYGLFSGFVSLAVSARSLPLHWPTHAPQSQPQPWQTEADSSLVCRSLLLLCLGKWGLFHSLGIAYFLLGWFTYSCWLQKAINFRGPATDSESGGVRTRADPAGAGVAVGRRNTHGSGADLFPGNWSSCPVVPWVTWPPGPWFSYQQNKEKVKVLLRPFAL